MGALAGTCFAAEHNRLSTLDELDDFFSMFGNRQIGIVAEIRYRCAAIGGKLFRLIDGLLPLEPLLNGLCVVALFLEQASMPLLEAMSIANQTILELSERWNRHRIIAAIFAYLQFQTLDIKTAIVDNRSSVSDKLGFL